jgi:hypothetical protein
MSLPARYHLTSQSQSQSYVTTDGQSASLSWCQAPSWAKDQIFVTLSCGFVEVRYPFWREEGVCPLQLLLVLAREVILGSESRWTHDHMLLSQIRDSPNIEGQIPAFIPQEQDGPVMPPSTGFPFCPLLRLAGWGDHLTEVKVKVKVKSRSMVNRPACLGVKHPSGAEDQIFITVRQLRVCCCGAPSVKRGRVCRLQLLLPSPAQSFSGPSTEGFMTKL